jgi:hypothetical protein
LKNTIKKGQKIWLWRYRGGITETIVTLVGRKYVTVDGSRARFEIENLREHEGVGFSSFLILDIDQYNREQQYNSLCTKLRKFDKWENVSKENLDKIKDLLKEYLE